MSFVLLYPRQQCTAVCRVKLILDIQCLYLDFNPAGRISPAAEGSRIDRRHRVDGRTTAEILPTIGCCHPQPAETPLPPPSPMTVTSFSFLSRGAARTRDAFSSSMSRTQRLFMWLFKPKEYRKTEASAYGKQLLDDCGVSLISNNAGGKIEMLIS